VRRRLFDRLFTVAAGAAAALAVGVLLGVVGLVTARGAGALSLTFLTEQVRSVGAEGGIFFQAVGTLILVATAAAFAVPVAAATALGVALYAPRSLRRPLEAALHALNGIPSIVFGLFGLALFFQLLGLGKSWLSGGLLLGLMIVPTVSVAFLEKLRAIPAATVEAATGLGLSRGALVTTVLLPQAASGLLTGTLLGLARAAGETAPIMFTAVIFAGATVPTGVVDNPVLALPYHIFVMAQDSFDPRVAEKVWGSAIVLVSLVFALSLVALPARLRVHEEARRA
jgi:phosphate transport system permease protein